MEALLERQTYREEGRKREREIETDGAASGELTFFCQSGAFANEERSNK